MEDALLQSQSQDSTSDNAHVINAFCEFTSSSREEAVFYLESHNFDLDAAVSTFFDSNNNPNNSNVGNNDRNLTDPTQPLQAPIPHSPTPSQSATPSSEFSPSESPLSRSRSTSPTPSRAPYALRSRRNSNKDQKKPSGSRTRGVRTLADLSRSAPDASDSDSDDQQEFYAGGEKSGVLVQGPPRTPASVDDIFDQARKMGADDNVAAEVPEKKTSKSFTGTARRLTGETISPAPSQPQAPEIVTHGITFWRNGFSVDDGPLRSLDDPQNAPFLESIKKSECPEELRPRNWRTSVHVNLIRKEENYPEQVKQRPAFQGVGRTLGSSSSSSGNNQTDSVLAEADTSLSTASLPSPGLVVDESLPITSIQLRLADGTRMVSRFNHHHTIGDVRAFIDASRPGGVRTYQLQTMGFPPKQLLDVNQTIEQGGIANSVVIQKL